MAKKKIYEIRPESDHAKAVENLDQIVMDLVIDQKFRRQEGALEPYYVIVEVVNR